MRINLLPPEYHPQPLIELRRVLLLTVAIVVLLSSLAFFGWYYLTCNNLAERIAELEGQIAVYEPAMAELEGIEAFIEKVRQWEREMERIKRLYPPHQQLLWSLAAALPREIWLTEVEIAPGQRVTVRGNSLNFQAMGRLLEEINSVKYFQSSVLKEVREVTSDEITAYHFEIEIEAGRDDSGKKE